MIDDAKAALADCQAELQQLDRRLAEANGNTDALTTAKVLVELDRIKGKVTKLATAVQGGGRPRGRR